jgi:hypothetical protein
MSTVKSILLSKTSNNTKFMLLKKNFGSIFNPVNKRERIEVDGKVLAIRINKAVIIN